MNNSKTIDISKEIELILSDKLFNDTDEVENNDNSSTDYDKKIDIINEEIDKLNKEAISLYNCLFDLEFLKEKNVLNVSGVYNVKRAAKIVNGSISFPEDTIIAAMETAQECNMKLKFCYRSKEKARLIHDKLKLLKGIKLKITKELDDTIEDNLKVEMNEPNVKVKYILSFYDFKKECIEMAIDKYKEYQKNGKNVHFYYEDSFICFYMYCCSKRECQSYIKEFKLLDAEVKYEIVELKGSKNGNA